MLDLNEYCSRAVNTTRVERGPEWSAEGLSRSSTISVGMVGIRGMKQMLFNQGGWGAVEIETGTQKWSYVVMERRR